ncbi:TVP38/TMEM64 family protein [Undibacter mobilis]|uniref:TVP38/TMEM64 family membrane protein n=1 Tax=Undibacter mobilis TaxID=2292256 RepID=A0A371B7G7_9BRAD|nr:TVP38/TMEM64 family protein [Undibacter mobilis]RDV03393.1 TVP38/TMEM64 family protein [Undibacter mobilis]
MTRHRRWLLLALTALAIAATVLAMLWLFWGVTSVAALQTRVESLGHWAPAGFIMLYAVSTVAGLPGGVLDVVGGAVFGPVYGSLINLAGGTLGAAGAFLVARHGAADWVRRRAGPRVQKVMTSVEADGWRFVAFVRLVPVIPYTIVNYMLGLTRIPFWHYVLATLVFMAPSTIAYTYIGYAGTQALAGDTDNIRYALLMLAVIALVIFAPYFYKRWKNGDETKAPPPV